MKNLSPYKLFEEDKLEVKSERKLLGFALSTIASYDNGDAISSYLVVGSAYTFQEFAFKVLEDLHGMEPEDISDSIKDIEDVDSEACEYSDPSSYESMFWHGLEPVTNEAFYDSIDLFNPVMASQLLRKYFSNSEVILARDRNGSSNDNTYIIKSIKNSPELLFRYENDGARYNDIVSNLGFTEDQIRSLKKYSQIKNQL
jgi:hypothetical protein